MQADEQVPKVCCCIAYMAASDHPVPMMLYSSSQGACLALYAWMASKQVLSTNMRQLLMNRNREQDFD